MNYWYIKDLSGTPLFLYRNTYTKNSATYFSPLSLLFFNRSNRCCEKTSIELFIAIRTRVLIPMIQSKFLWKYNSKFSQTFHFLHEWKYLSKIAVYFVIINIHNVTIISRFTLILQCEFIVFLKIYIKNVEKGGKIVAGKNYNRCL